MRRTYLLCLACLPLLRAVPACADEVAAPAGGWTLAALTARAVERSIAVAAAEAELEAARLRLPAASARERPEISVDGGLVVERDGAGMGAGPLAEARITRVLERPSTRRARARVAEAEVVAAAVELDRVHADVRADVARRMIRLAAAQLLRDAREAHHARLASTAGSLAGRGSAVPAVAAEVGTLDVAARLAAARAERARGEVADAWLELEELVHLHADAPPEIAFRLPGDLPEPDADGLVESARTAAFPVRALAAAAASASTQAELERRSAAPSVALSPFVSRSSALGSETTAGLGLSLPWPGGRAAPARAAAAGHSARAAALRLDLGRHLSGHHVEHVVARLASARRRCALFPLRGLAAADSGAEQVRIRFLSGRIPLPALLASLDVTLEATEETVSAHREAAEAWVDLAFASGREVTLP